MKHTFLSILLTLVFQEITAQNRSISITIDDVPNTLLYQEDGYQSKLLKSLDSMDIPFTIFINEDKIFKTDAVNNNKELLKSWIICENALIGNHTYSHLRYSDVGYERFIEDVERGAILSKVYAGEHGKSLDYFRFPFNDLGKDSIQHIQIKKHLISEGYIIAPFTVESSDWMFDTVYKYYLNKGEIEKAHAIGENYVTKTIELVRFYEEMSLSLYGRQIKHIYLCHDNAINADFLSEIIIQLRNNGYVIESFQRSLTDPVYNQQDVYFKKWGISWLYRWMDSHEARMKWMNLEPDMSRIQSIFNTLNSD